MSCSSAIAALCFIISLLVWGSVSQYQLTCSDYNSTSNKYYLPNFGSRESVLHETWEPSNPGASYIYPVNSSQINCSGTITDVEYCYTRLSSDYGSNQLVFYLVLLKQNNSRLNVLDYLPVYSIPDAMKCRLGHSPVRCCDIMTLPSGNTLQFPIQDIAIGITIPAQSNVLLQGFHSTTVKYSVPYYLTSLRLMDGQLLHSLSISVGSPRLVWFHIEPEMTPMPTIHLSTTQPIPLMTASLHIPEPDSSTTIPEINASFPILQQTTNSPSTPLMISLSTPHVSSTSPIPQPNSTLNFQQPNSQRIPQLSPTSSINQLPTTTPISQLTNVTAKLTNVSPSSLSTLQAATTPPTNQLASILVTLQMISTLPISIPQPTSTLPVSQMTSILLTPQLSTSSSFSQFLNSKTTTKITKSSALPSSTSTVLLNTVPIANTDLNFGSSNESDVIGGAVGGGIVLFLLLISCTLAILFIKKRQQRKKEWTIAKSKHTGNIFSNAIYSNDTSTSGDNTGLENPAYDDAIVGAQAGNKLHIRISGQNEKYEYIEANVSEYNHLRRRDMVADIYVIPPSDVTQLYAQLEYVRADKLTRENVKLNKLLGSGQFGEVYQGVWNGSNCDLQVAVKTLKENSTEQDRIKFLQEAAIMGQFRHANVVTMYGVISEGKPVLLVLEILKKGDLRKHLIAMRIDHGNEISPELKDLDLLTYCRQVASGMEYLSSKAFAHRDLAARNILVSENNICKIADFGMSRDLMDETYYVSKGGVVPVKWTAPEALYYRKYSTASDVWSYGVVMYEIWSVGHKPFENVSNIKVVKIIELGYRLPPPPGCPRTIYSIMMSCWAPATGQRPTFSVIRSQLSNPNSELLYWSKESEVINSTASKIGAELTHGNDLYKDLQAKYMKIQTKKH